MSERPAIVTISAPYGTAGGLVGVKVAEALGVPFLDRAIPVAVARNLAIPVTEVLEREEHADTRMQRLLSALAATTLTWGPMLDPQIGSPLTEQRYKEVTEHVIKEAAALSAGGCVILGRAAVVVLRDHPSALHVWLRGDFERRVKDAALRSGDDEKSSRRLVEETDKNRETFFRDLYRANPDDARLYHLVLDSTALSQAFIVETIVAAARDRAASGSLKESP